MRQEENTGSLPDTQAVPSPVGAPFPLLSPYSHNTVPPSPTCMGSPYPITKSHSFSRTLSHASSTEAFCNATALRVPALLWPSYCIVCNFSKVLYWCNLFLPVSCLFPRQAVNPCCTATVSYTLRCCPRPEKVLTHDQPFNKYSSTQKPDRIRPAILFSERKIQQGPTTVLLSFKSLTWEAAGCKTDRFWSQAWAGILTLPLPINFI